MSGKVAEWLENLGLGQFAAAFEENAIDWELLPDVDQNTLKDIGIKEAGFRLRIMKGIAALQSEASGSYSHLTGPSTDVSPSSLETDHDLSTWSRTPGERKPVTMLFADITGSTALTENLDAEETHDLLYGATRCMCEAVENNRGTLCRFMGDGVMAMFGAPVASEHHAVEAALAMQQAVRDYAINSDSTGLRIRIGLHSGEVVVLRVGDGVRLSTTPRDRLCRLRRAWSR